MERGSFDDVIFIIIYLSLQSRADALRRLFPRQASDAVNEAQHAFVDDMR